MKKKKGISSFLNKKALNYGMHPDRQKRLMTLLGKDIEKKKILDIGCSTGYFGKLLKDQGAYVVGVDISADAIEDAKKNLDEALVLDVNIERLPHKKGEFDIVVAAEVIQFLYNPEMVLRELNRVLKDDGKLVITTPNLLYWGNRLKFLKGEFVYQKIGVFDEGHVHFYTNETLKEDLKKSGFKIVKQNHLFAGPESLSAVKSKFPGVFAYQFVILCQKEV